MNRILLTAAAVALLLAGCGKDATKQNVVQPPETKVNQQGNSGQGIGAGQGNQASSLPSAGGSAMGTGMMDPFEDPSNPLSQHVIYFDYNSSQVQDINIVNAHARYMMENPGSRVRLEGHADERGSREFNVALSERRGQEVKRLIMFQGVRASQMSITAYGEERPLAFGHGESSWQENRRVEIVYEAK